MKGKSLFLLIGLLAPFLMVTGGIIYAITGEMGVLPISLMWIGLLALLLFFYVYFPEIREFIAKRSTKYAVNTAIMTSVFLVIIVLTGIMSVKFKVRVDLTDNSRYTLSSQTVKILKSLKNDVEVIAFYRSDERTRQAMLDLLKEYSYYSTKFNFRFVDPDKNPEQTVKYGVTSYRTTLLKYGDKQEIIGTESESRLTTALIKLLSDKVKTIYFLKGHGEKSIEDKKASGYSLAREAMQKENHQVRELLLMSRERVPEDASVVVVAGPENDLLPNELEKVTAYLQHGGKVLFMLDPGAASGLSGYLGEFGFEIGNDIIIDKQSQIYGANYLTPVVEEYSDKHILTHDFSVATFLPAARSVKIAEDPNKGRYNLAKTSVNSWTVTGELTDENLKYDPDRHRRGPIEIMAVTAVEVEVGGESTEKAGESLRKWGKLMVVGDSDFAGNTHLKLAGNKDLFLNTINWLAEEKILIAIRKKEIGLTPLMMTATQGNLAFWLSVVIIPSLVMVLGIGVTVSKRREA